MPGREPVAERDTDNLYPAFKASVDAWFAEVSITVPHISLRVTEGLRTLERQRYLYAQGREEPYKNAPEITWTMDSRHRWGLAVDVAMIRRATGEAIWTPSSWVWLYRVTTPERYGLRNLIPTEYVHLEWWWANEAVNDAKALGLTQA